MSVSTPPEPPEGSVARWDFTSWSRRDRGVLGKLLEEDGISFLWEHGILNVEHENRQDVQEFIDGVAASTTKGVATQPLPTGRAPESQLASDGEWCLPDSVPNDRKTSTCRFCGTVSMETAANHCTECGAPMRASAVSPAPKPDALARWVALRERWTLAILILPKKRTTKRGFGLWPMGFTPDELPGKRIAELASGFGRPTIWTPEPASGGVIVGVPIMRYLAAHVDRLGTCDRVFEKAVNELDLSWRLRTLGTLTGRPMDSVISWMGLPNSRSGGVGYTLLQWHVPGFHVALKFDAQGICMGITHQHVHRPVVV